MSLFSNDTNTFEKWVFISSPVDGNVITLEEVPDEIFSKKLAGDGLAIIPYSNCIYSISDAFIDIFQTNHAISFETMYGLQILLHIGIDTVKLLGNGFEKVSESPLDVPRGAKLLNLDLNYIEKNAKSLVTPLIITNMGNVDKIVILKCGKVKAGDIIMKVKLKQ